MPILDIRELIRHAFAAARDKGKPDWWRMTTPVFKNRLLALTDRQVYEEDYGTRTVAEFASRFPNGSTADAAVVDSACLRKVIHWKPLLLAGFGKYPLTARRVRDPRIATTPVALVTQLALPNDYARRVAADMLGRDVASAKFGTSYLTRRAIDIEVAGSLNGKGVQDAVVSGDLSHTVPILHGATPLDLLKLRDEEQDAFKTYQVALRKAALEAAGPVHVETLFADVVAPEIRRMNATLKDARRSLIQSVTSHEHERAI